MEASRIFFTKETKNKMEQGLNISQRGKLRWQKVKEAEESGRLAMAKNRTEVAYLAGFTEATKNRGYQWVANMVRRKHLQEIIVGMGDHGFVEYEYHVVSDPDYDKKNAHKNRWANNKANTAPKKQESAKTTMLVSEVAKGTNKYKLEFSRGEVTIRLELDDYEKVAELIKAILKGE